MARTELTPFTALGPFGTYSAGLADITMTAADTTDQNSAKLTGKVLLIAHNTGVGVQTVTVTSVTCEHGRSGDITAYSLAADDYAILGPFEPKGWLQSDGMLYFEANSADVLLGLVKLE